MLERLKHNIRSNKILGRLCSYHTLLLISSIALVGFYNASFWRVITPDISQYLGNIGFVILPLVYVLILWGACEIFCARASTKLFLSVIFVIAGVSRFFMDSMGIGINASIIESVFNTNIRESKDFVTISFLAHIALFVLLPLVIIFLFPIKIKSNKESVGFYASSHNNTNIIPPPHHINSLHCIKIKLSLIIGIIIAIVAMYGFYGKDIVFLFKKHNWVYVRTLLNPMAPISASIDYAYDRISLSKGFRHIAVDAHTESRGMVFVLVIGESERAANYPLNGYERDTTPYSRDFGEFVNFSKFYSCGVITAISLPCMLTPIASKDYNNRKLSYHTENLLDVALKAGYEVYWVSNNGGSCIGGVCDRLKPQNITYYNKTSDLDSDMLPHIQKLINNASGLTLIVVNLLGSHGARYDLRYPKHFEVFTPVCKRDDIQKCDKAHIINAYDNSLLHTDFFITQIARMLKSKINSKNSYLQAGLWFISDHGESLGEMGQYMHGGFPYALASDYQKHIPSMIYLSNASMRDKLKSSTTKTLNHDYVFHTILRLLEIKTNIYDKRLDIIEQ